MSTYISSSQLAALQNLGLTIPSAQSIEAVVWCTHPDVTFPVSLVEAVTNHRVIDHLNWAHMYRRGEQSSYRLSSSFGRTSDSTFTAAGNQRRPTQSTFSLFRQPALNGAVQFWAEATMTNNLAQLAIDTVRHLDASLNPITRCEFLLQWIRSLTEHEVQAETAATSKEESMTGLLIATVYNLASRLVRFVSMHDPQFAELSGLRYTLAPNVNSGTCDGALLRGETGAGVGTENKLLISSDGLRRIFDSASGQTVNGRGFSLKLKDDRFEAEGFRSYECDALAQVVEIMHANSLRHLLYSSPNDCVIFRMDAADRIAVSRPLARMPNIGSIETTMSVLLGMALDLAQRPLSTYPLPAIPRHIWQTHNSSNMSQTQRDLGGQSQMPPGQQPGPSGNAPLAPHPLGQPGPASTHAFVNVEEPVDYESDDADLPADLLALLSPTKRKKSIDARQTPVKVRMDSSLINWRTFSDNPLPRLQLINANVLNLASGVVRMEAGDGSFLVRADPRGVSHQQLPTPPSSTSPRTVALVQAYQSGHGLSLILDKYLDSGATCDVFSAKFGNDLDVVVKVSLPETHSPLGPQYEHKLRVEGQMYRHMASLQGDIIPRYGGLWHLNGMIVLLVESLGRGLDVECPDWRYVKYADRLRIKHILDALSAAGVQYNDLALRHFRRTANGQLQLIDFGDASFARPDQTTHHEEVETLLQGWRLV